MATYDLLYVPTWLCVGNSSDEQKETGVCFALSTPSSFLSLYFVSVDGKNLNLK